MHLTYTG